MSLELQTVSDYSLSECSTKGRNIVKFLHWGFNFITVTCCYHCPLRPRNSSRFGLHIDHCHFVLSIQSQHFTVWHRPRILKRPLLGGKGPKPSSSSESLHSCHRSFRLTRIPDERITYCNNNRHTCSRTTSSTRWIEVSGEAEIRRYSPAGQSRQVGDIKGGSAGAQMWH